MTRVACRGCLAHYVFRVPRLDFIALEHLDVATAIMMVMIGFFFMNYLIQVIMMCDSCEAVCLFSCQFENKKYW